MSFPQLLGYFLYSISHFQAGAVGSPKADQCSLVGNQALTSCASIAPIQMGLTQVPYFHSHMHQCLPAQCQEKTCSMSQRDKILARKSFAREEGKVPLQAASKFMLSLNYPSANLTFYLPEVQWTFSVSCCIFFFLITNFMNCGFPPAWHFL